MLLALLMVYLQKDGSCSYPKPSLVKESFPFCEIYLLRKEGALIHFAILKVHFTRRAPEDLPRMGMSLGSAQLQIPLLYKDDLI